MASYHPQIVGIVVQGQIVMQETHLRQLQNIYSPKGRGNMSARGSIQNWKGEKTNRDGVKLMTVNCRGLKDPGKIETRHSQIVKYSKQDTQKSGMTEIAMEEGYLMHAEKI